MIMTFITLGGESLEVTKEDRKATRSEGMGLEERASSALMRHLPSSKGTQTESSRACATYPCTESLSGRIFIIVVMLRWLEVCPKGLVLHCGFELLKAQELFGSERLSMSCFVRFLWSVRLTVAMPSYVRW